MNTLAIIPARYASTRFPGKPLALLGGKAIVDYAFSTAAATPGIGRAVVATDDDRIRDHMEAAFGPASVMLTAPTHQSGTDRCGEVVRRMAAEGYCPDIVVNLQGDEPFVRPSQLEALIACFDNPAIDIATLMAPIASSDELLSPNNVKVVCTADGRALYFSRQPIPYRRGEDPSEWAARGRYHKHVGIYAFRTATLQAVCALPQGHLETCEKLEQLRWLESGFTIAVRETPVASIGIDTPADLAEAELILNRTK